MKRTIHSILHRLKSSANWWRFRGDLLLIPLWGVIGGACTDADQFYEKLDRQPEIVANYNAVYTVGDTLTIQGRLNPENNLLIRIGGVEASILDITPLPTNTEKANVLITETMGIGENRTVTITSAGITISGPAIEIVGNAGEGILPYQLQLQKVADIPSGVNPIYCRSGNGNVYLWNTTAKKLLKLTPRGELTEVFTESASSDANGAFNIAEFYAGAVSPDEHNFYFSAKVMENGQERTMELYKFCRFDLQTGELAILNRTEYDLRKSERTLASVQPFEGKLNEVKIFKITAIYPDSEGNVYCSLMEHFLTRLDKNGNYSYLFNFTLNSLINKKPDEDFVPQINNPETGEYYSAVWIHQIFPGLLSSYPPAYFDLEEKIMYSVSNYGLALVDMTAKVKIGEYPPLGLNSDLRMIPYANASLNTFNGGLVDNIISTLTNNTFDPLALNRKLLGVYFRKQVNLSGDAAQFYVKYELPALCEIDFENNSAKRYAPGRLIMNGYDIITTYQILNYDADGMLYLTANNNQVIVKTAIYNEENE